MSGKAPALVLYKPKDLIAAPVEWVVEGLVPRGMLTILSGKDKLGKTLLAWELTRAVCRGTPFLGQFPVKHGPVCLLALDAPAIITRERITALGLDDADNLLVATPMSYQHRDQTFWAELAAQVRDMQPALLVVDALYLFLQGGPEVMNQAGGMGPIMQRLNEIAEAQGTAVLLITHDTKSGQDVAGSFVIRAAAKHILRLQQPEHASDGKRELVVEDKLIERLRWTLEFRGPGEWTLDDAAADRLAEVRAQVDTWLHQGHEGTVDHISKALSKRRSDVEAALGRFVTEGTAQVIATPSEGRGRPKQIYRANFRPDPNLLGAGPKIEGEAP